MKITLKKITFIFLFILPTFVSAGKPVTGVSCHGGFFVLAPDRNIFWVDAAYENKHQVYTGRAELVAMSQCGAGVLSVFRNKKGKVADHFAVYSDNCMNIGNDDAHSKTIYRGREAVRRISPSDTSVTLSFTQGTEREIQGGCEI